MQAPAKASPDAAVADPANAAVLNEYGFTDVESGQYSRDDGRKLTLKAARFQDASGAYGAFTFYKTLPMRPEKIGDQGASFNERVLFERGNILVDAVFQGLTVMSAAELRELASVLPLPSGGALNLPNLPSYLPKQSFVANSEKYITGPIALERVHAALPMQLVDFNAGAEAVLGSYNTSAGDATLLLISYPTPQIAIQQIRSVEAAHPLQANGAASGPNDVPVFVRRSGPIVAVAIGAISQSEAKSLLASVNYEADVTWNENTYMDKKNNIGTLVFNALILSGILILFALVIGVAFGGARIVLGRLFPHKVFDRPENVEFIALHLDEAQGEAPDSGVSSSIKAI